MMTFTAFAALGLLLPLVSSAWVDQAVLDACPGYRASNVRVNGGSLTADLRLGGKACNVFGSDIARLRLQVDYETETRIHVKITDAASKRYEVPESVFPRPKSGKGVSPRQAAIRFNYTESPFSFSIIRSKTSEVLFTTASSPLIYEPQYLRLKTRLPSNPNIYGLGEHTNSFRLDPKNTTLTIWSRDAYGVPGNTNLYGNHPVYFEQRTTGSHGVLLLNSNGMDIKISESGGVNSLEYNVIGGILDFYFLAGSETDPTELTRQYSQVAGLPAEVPFWGFGFHQCRFGYKDYVDIARVISRYAESDIPLETMWADIDYMDRRLIFTVDPQYFPMGRMREIVKYLHEHDQHFITMTDPAVGTKENYEPYTRGSDLDIWVKTPTGEDMLGLVWPGVTVYPDWFHPRIEEYWTGEFKRFYSAENGLDIDGSWIDMNEPANFCDLPCDNIYEQERLQNLPPPRSQPPPSPDVPIFVNTTSVRRSKRDILNPPYRINNAAPTGDLSSKTGWVNGTHANGLVEYDVHNLYGTMMSSATQKAMLARRPGRRTLIITRSTFAGAGRDVGKWLGDNVSQWHDYRISIAGILGFAGVYQVPMVGADICGFVGNTTESLCARWAMLGAFYPFMRNHNADNANYQEFYEWPVVADAARKAIDIRYRLLDYLYTAFHRAHMDGTAVLQPLWYQFPKEPETYPIDLQFFFGDSVLISPVTEEGATSVSAYFPKEIFYDFNTFKPIQGKGARITFHNVSLTDIPVHIRGGSVIPLRTESAMTIAELREKAFEIVVAPNSKGEAKGSLYLDDGESIKPASSTYIQFRYSQGRLYVSGTFGRGETVKVQRIRVLGAKKPSRAVRLDGKEVSRVSQEGDGPLDIEVDTTLTKDITIEL